ncbi:hypothetical protein BJ508DRAFT_65304 [Ascobolus immersus RN42]|uniref:Uncharacterized protein n=1 Tax=Ascobolus immersus RN42 TaxID=1160509 RepID=A0A3N4IUI1_ASCIM|nr:hypothetical protein BJ508DRAFT_65304 [Ascobolus immersus RN42]
MSGRYSTMKRHNLAPVDTSSRSTRSKYEEDQYAFPLDAEDDIMGSSFLSFCAHCDTQILVPNNSLFCSERCRRLDSTKSTESSIYYTASSLSAYRSPYTPPLTPPSSHSTFISPLVPTAPTPTLAGSFSPPPSPESNYASTDRPSHFRSHSSATLSSTSSMGSVGDGQYKQSSQYSLSSQQSSYTRPLPPLQPPSMYSMRGGTQPSPRW